MQTRTDPDRSVLSNLDEIMQIERDRIARERALEVEARARAERERNAAEAAERAAEERAEEGAARRERAAVLRAERHERRREAVLLRAQLDAESAARAGQAAREQEHALELERLRLDARRRLWTRVLTCAALAIGAVVLGLGVGTQRMLEGARARAEHADAMLDDARRATDALRARLRALPAEPRVADGALATPGTASAPPPPTQAPSKGGSTRSPKAPRSAGSASQPGSSVPLGDIDEESNDPLSGMLEDEGPKRRR